MLRLNYRTQQPQPLLKKNRKYLIFPRQNGHGWPIKNVDSLNGLFDEKCVFVHMGGSWGKNQEMNTIKGGGIWYKKAEVYGASVNIFGNTAILLNDIDLLAVVGGNEVTHAFMVTEVYLKENGKWKLGSLTFSTLLRPVKMTTNK